MVCGLGLVDIKQFWQSLKFSWIRRLTNTGAFWPKILEQSINNIHGSTISLTDFLQLGPNKIVFIGKKMSNPFWNQVFSGVMPFMQGAIFCHPDKIFVAPFWDNPIITRNNKAIKPSSFPTFSHKIKTISEFFQAGSNNLLTKLELENTYKIEISEESLLEINYIINTTFRSLGINQMNFVAPFLPIQPLLINISNVSKKGCGSFSKFLKKKTNLNSQLVDREAKWHSELQTQFNINFWNKTYTFTAGIKFENKIKWLQYQIARNSLFTNYKVHKFKPHISPLCTFCTHIENPPHYELVSHIFWSCIIVNQFWQDLADWLGTLGVQLNLTRNSALFGIHEKKITAKENYLILFSKYFIWKSKFTTKTLTLNIFQKYLFKKLNDLKNALAYIENQKFEQWLVIYDYLSRLPSCTEQEAAPLPPIQPPTGTLTPHQAPAAGSLAQEQAAAPTGTPPPSQVPEQEAAPLPLIQPPTGTLIPNQAPAAGSLAQEQAAAPTGTPSPTQAPAGSQSPRQQATQPGSQVTCPTTTAAEPPPTA